MKRSLLLTLICIYCTLLVQAQAPVWTAMTNYPTIRYSAYGFMIGNRFFLGGGATVSSPLAATNDLMEYNFSTDQWESRASLPAGVDIYGQTQFVVNGKAYVTCGQLVPVSGGFTTALYEYDPVADVWASKAVFPGAGRYTASSFAVGDYGYVGLGFSPYQNDFYKYNPATNVWSQISNFPGTARQSASAFVINGVPYVGLGYNGSGTVSDMYKYNTSSNTWTAVASFPGTGRYGASAIVLNNKAYLLGGADASVNALQDVWSYDPQTNAWTSEGNEPLTDLIASASGSNGSLAVVGTGRNSLGNFTNRIFKTGSPLTGITETAEMASPQVWYGSGKLSLSFGSELSEPALVTLRDLAGRELLSKELARGSAHYTVDMNSLPEGCYIFQVRSQTGALSTAGKIMKQN